MADEGLLRAQNDVEAAMAGLAGPYRAPNLRSAKKMPEESPSVCCGQGRDAKLRSEIGLERFQAQPKWEIPDGE